MATNPQKEEIVEVLKYIPTTVNLAIYGIGAEVVVGGLSEAQYEYWSKRTNDELVDHFTNWTEESDIPKELQIVQDGAWYDADELGHKNGCELISDNTIHVIDDNDDTVWERQLGYSELDDHGIALDSSEIYARNTPGIEYAYAFEQSERGTFFSADIVLTTPFDPKKLSIFYIDIEGLEVITSIEYNGEELDGFDAYDTTGNGHYCEIFKVDV